MYFTLLATLFLVRAEVLTDEELQWKAIAGIANALAPVVGSVVGNIVNNNRQELSAE